MECPKHGFELPDCKICKIDEILDAVYPAAPLTTSTSTETGSQAREHLAISLTERDSLSEAVAKERERCAKIAAGEQAHAACSCEWCTCANKIEWKIRGEI